ncbi:unnamed protein product [Dovyalis caffra]|uniref:Uncharacterized protein n=1 Tax=Dovyalis caffra TaxID=77055 RepID=A0AAV1RBP6_9ROSI|nr:unnamed protein product [Dovyalis caffra]
MAQLVSTFKAMAIFFVVAMYFATVTAQDFEMAPAPAPTMDKGAAYSLRISGAQRMLSKENLSWNVRVVRPGKIWRA